MSVSTAVTSNPRGVIIYLAQVTHSSYGRDSLDLLKRSLRSLFTHYNNVQRDDVVILHQGDFTPAIQASFLAEYKDKPVTFRLLDEQKYCFALPPNMKHAAY